MLDFGPDGYLYVPLGDGGAANDRFGNGQNPDALLGKILRLDVTSDPQQPYVVPAGNPFVAADWNGQDVRDEVWAIGLRNPWRTSFDRLTGDFWVADVGQNQIEEINVIPAGAAGGLNLGWPIMEGKSCFGSASCDQAGLTLPAVDYTHSDGNCSVTGGYVYRGQRVPGLEWHLFLRRLLQWPCLGHGAGQCRRLGKCASRRYRPRHLFLWRRPERRDLRCRLWQRHDLPHDAGRLDERSSPRYERRCR